MGQSFSPLSAATMGGKKRCGSTHRPAGHGFCPCRFQNKRPGREEKKSLVPQSGEEEER